MPEYLNIFDLCKGTRALGPGLRFAVWVQGCPFNCKGCTSPYGRAIEEKTLVEINSVADSIIKNQHIEGITISGGEPFLQASKLSLLLKTVNDIRPELNVLVFTGFKLESLNWDEAKDLMSQIDLLIDGQYIEELNDNKGLRGSSNQRFHYLTEKLKIYKEEFENGNRNLEIFIHDSYKRIIGVPNKVIIDKI